MAFSDFSHTSLVQHPSPKIHREQQQLRPQVFKHHSGTSNSDTDDATFLDGEPNPYVNENRRNDVQSVIGVSISRQQTRLASPETPATEKAAAIQRGGGYFSLEGQNDQSTVGSISPSDSESMDRMETINGSSTSPEPHGPHSANHGNSDRRSTPVALATVKETTEERPVISGRQSQAQLRGQKKTSADVERVNNHLRTSSNTADIASTSRRSHSTTRSSIKDHQIRQNQLHRPSLGLRRVSSDGSLSVRRALSTASSLGDDTRFEHVKEQINNRFKAIKDSFQDSNFRLPKVPPMPTLPTLPNLPKLPNILGVVSRNPQKDEDARQASPTREHPSSDRRESVMETLRKRTASKPKPVPTKEQSTTQPSAGMTSANAAAQPNFVKAISQLTGDIVIMGGYRGSVLRSTEAPHQRLWIPFKAGLNIGRVNLEVGLTDEDEETTPVFADGMLDHIGPVDLSRRLLKRLRASPNAQSGKLRVHSYGYDWRLSPHRLSAQLIQFLATLPCNSESIPPQQRGAWVMAHSLGGLITRHAVNHRPDVFAGVVYAGTPQNCANVLGPLKHGDDVLFSSKVLTPQTNFTIRTSYVFLPLNGKLYVDETTGKELPVDFFSVDDWIRYELSPVVAKPNRRNSKLGLLDSFPQSISIPRSIGDVMDNLPFRRRNSLRKHKPPGDNTDSSPSSASDAVVNHGMGPQMGSKPDTKQRMRAQTRSNITIPHAAAVSYLRRTLAACKAFKLELAHNSAYTQSNAYPPFAVIYGKSEPTVCAARVTNGYAGIARPDVYDNLTFASGDGVVLAREAMLPEGYRAAKGGVVGSDRGHITLLGDIDAVGRSLLAVMRARRSGVGLLGGGSGGGGRLGGERAGRSGELETIDGSATKDDGM